ncbi:hypothetical protein ABFS82_07G060800 [Erythranthe guttata]|nr:PREDICTED: glucan endo-1,3-beta-D-glucosidase-like [Erythranthe guttata]|eukprot:XP_012844199.1 PREDICTED: glucan endo-1,3-beta-D-glucosidase-like [Erythranthe guttata]
MDKINMLSLFLICCLFGAAYGYKTNSKPSGQKDIPDTWCIAKPNAPQDKLQGFINYACGEVDCGVVQPGGQCYDPNTVLSHASYVLDLIYIYRKSCNPDIGIITTVDPSYGDCKYP